MNEETRAEGVSKAKETITRGARSGALAAASGGVMAVRALNALRQRKWKRAGVRLLATGFWFGVAAFQRRSGGSDGSGPGGVDVDQRDVANTSPDIEDVATDADEGTGTESHGDPSKVVDTMSADIDESDTATELDSDVDASDVEQRDVVETGVDASDVDADESEDDEAEEPAHTDNAHVVEEEGETELVEEEGDEDGDAADSADTDAGGGEDEDAEPRSVDGDAEPAITESAEDEEEEEEEESEERPAE